MVEAQPKQTAVPMEVSSSLKGSKAVGESSGGIPALSSMEVTLS